jgi:hypothetical protein
MSNIKLGYYSTENKIFFNKIDAILHSNQTNEKLKWNYNRDIFDKVDWSIEPETTLDELYRSRAKQIREEYDYVILMLSGGADSSNMLASFINNGLTVDEVIAGAPLSGLSNWKYNTEDQSANNQISETKYAQLPLVDRLSKTHPDIKITIHDYFEDILDLKSESWIYESSSHWIHFSGTARHSLDKFKHIKNMAENGKRIAVVYGIDKPVLQKMANGDIYTIVVDAIINIVTSHFKERYDNVESVLFYYAPELPTLMVKQAHEVCRWIHRPENSNILNFMADDTKSKDFNSNPIRGSRWQRGIVPCIYPSLETVASFWQADKQSLGFKGGAEMDYWMYSMHGNSKIVDMVNSEIRGFVNPIKDQYFVDGNKSLGFVRFINAWKIGNVKDFIKPILT